MIVKLVPTGSYLENPIILMIFTVISGYLSKLLFDKAATFISFGDSLIDETDREIYAAQWFLRNESNGKSTMDFESKKDEMMKDLKKNMNHNKQTYINNYNKVKARKDVKKGKEVDEHEKHFIQKPLDQYK